MPRQEFRTGDALFTVDRSLIVLSWNAAAEQLTGVAAGDAVGHHCWEILGGLGEHGDVVCHSGCAKARLAREGFPVSCHALLVRTPACRARVNVSTVALDDGRLLHVLVPPNRSPKPAAVRLTARQREVLDLMADGVPAKAIAARLGTKETTIRTYIRAVLRELGAHSQLEAVAKARRSGLVDG